MSLPQMNISGGPPGRVGRNMCGVRGIDDDLAGKIVRTAKTDRVFGAVPQRREHGHFGERRGLGKCAGGRARSCFRRPRANLLAARIARPNQHIMAKRCESGAERFADLA